jgi:chromosome segregation ATPase
MRTKQSSSLQERKAQVLFWRLVDRLKREETKAKDPMGILNEKMDTLNLEMSFLKSEVEKSIDAKSDRQRRLEEIEGRINSDVNKRMNEIKQLEEQILSLENLHSHYSKHAPEHKEHLDRIKRKIDVSKIRLTELKQR